MNAQATSIQWPKPEDVTPEMLDAFRSAYKEGDFWKTRIHGALCAMLSAAPQPAQAVPDGLKDKLTDLLADGLRGTWHCNRAWEAWHVGTMSINDFWPVDESDTPAELADAVIAMLSAAPAAPQPAQQPLTAQVEQAAQPVKCTHFTDEQVSKAMDGKGWHFYSVPPGTPLYTSPPKAALDLISAAPAAQPERKPMTKEQAAEVAKQLGWDEMPERFPQIVQAVERHHDIKEDASAAPAAQHPDDEAVDKFAAAMKSKLALAREKGRGGWETCPPEELSRMLREHVEKGDPRDVANFCMFLWSLGYGITAAPAAQPEHKPMTQGEMLKLLGDHLDTDELTGDDYRLIRAVERYHGIKEQP